MLHKPKFFLECLCRYLTKYLRKFYCFHEKSLLIPRSRLRIYNLLLRDFRVFQSANQIIAYCYLFIIITRQTFIQELLEWFYKLCSSKHIFNTTFFITIVNEIAQILVNKNIIIQFNLLFSLKNGPFSISMIQYF